MIGFVESDLKAKSLHPLLPGEGQAVPAAGGEV